MERADGSDGRGAVERRQECPVCRGLRGEVAALTGRIEALEQRVTDREFDRRYGSGAQRRRELGS